LKAKNQQISKDERDKNSLKTLLRILKVKRQELLKKILENINKNLLLLRDEREVKRQRKRSSYLNNYKFSLTIKRTRRNFNNLINLNKDNRNNCDKQNCTNINLKDYKKI